MASFSSTFRERPAFECRKRHIKCTCLTKARNGKAISRPKFFQRIAESFWALIHVGLLVGFQHRLMVAIQWLWRYVTYERGSRLIAEGAAGSRAL
jgi:NADH dehydrogenase FAD-containing subunit